MSLLIRNAHVVNAGSEYTADVYAADGVIRQIGMGLDVTADRVIDASGLLVLPGGVDPHTHLAYDLGETATADDYASGTAAAACGGTTTVINFTRQDASAPLMSVVDRANAEAGAVSAIDFGQHLVLTRIDDESLAELGAVIKAGVTSIKVFMAYPGELMVDDASIFRVMRVAGANGVICCVHAENGPVVDEYVREALRAGHTNPSWHGRTRPERAESEATHRAIALAEMAGASVYLVHVSCDAALREIVTARDAGQPVFAETCPQYLVLDSSEYDDDSFAAARYVFTPPLRDQRNQAELWRGLRTGDLQVVATDHCPFNLAGQKEIGRDDFSRIPNGAPVIENRLQLLYGLGVRAGRLSLQQLVAVTAANPARIFGLANRKGVIAVGADADFVLLDPDGTTTISASSQHMHVDYSLFEGWTVPGSVETVILRGKVIAEGGHYVGTPGDGRYVARGSSG